jgi:hypothetical protein
MRKRHQRQTVPLNFQARDNAMNKVIIAGLVTLGAATSLLVPTKGETAVFALTRKAPPVRLADGRQAPVVCRTSASWSYDYDGTLYLKKKRVCA